MSEQKDKNADKAYRVPTFNLASMALTPKGGKGTLFPAIKVPRAIVQEWGMGVGSRTVYFGHYGGSSKHGPFHVMTNRKRQHFAGPYSVSLGLERVSLPRSFVAEGDVAKRSVSLALMRWEGSTNALVMRTGVLARRLGEATRDILSDQQLGSFVLGACMDLPDSRMPADCGGFVETLWTPQFITAAFPELPPWVVDGNPAGN